MLFLARPRVLTLQVRREVERDSLLGGGAGASGTPQQQGEAAAAAAAAGAAGRMDIKDLSWEDRERILRLLFAKINNQAQQAYYSSLPLHPLEPQLEGMYTDAGPSVLM